MSDTPPRFVVRGAFALARDPLPVRGPFVVARNLAKVDVPSGDLVSRVDVTGRADHEHDVDDRVPRDTPDAAELVAAPVDDA